MKELNILSCCKGVLV